MTLTQIPPAPAPDLEPTQRWATVSPVEGPRTSQHRHVVAEGKATSVCGITALPETMWRRDRSKPECPSCTDLLARGASTDPDLHGRTVIRRRSFFSRAAVIEETYYPSRAERTEQDRQTIRDHVPAEHADAIIALVESGALSMRLVEWERDKDGGFEDERGSCVRDVDEATVRTVTALVFTTDGLDPGAPTAPTGGTDR